MRVIEAIEQRRSIRRYTGQPVSEDVIREVLHAATLAPSGKNRQPWRFVVVQGEKREEMVRVMREGIAARKAEGVGLGSSAYSAGIMAQAPVTIFVFDGLATAEDQERALIDFLMTSVDIQSIGAAIQNMLLAATAKGLGSLWVCDVFYAYSELCDWLGENHVMVAAVALGYPDEAPNARPRRSVDEVTRWLTSS